MWKRRERVTILDFYQSTLLCSTDNSAMFIIKHGVECYDKNDDFFSGVSCASRSESESPVQSLR
ncbi:hypothetical protein M758_7G159900 [Ceratodon purpureus]|nr:hypothetical protein KC19_N009500 [Ceratodon purpureus]KAG0504579.1 hypothetical protein KC19_N014700 [Ceratodon purpureus]KAG0611705.1 hypothetical protein M758_7G159900 [Ceratodon purpureus]